MTEEAAAAARPRTVVSASEFAERLARLCIGRASSRVFPRKEVDRHVLMRAAITSVPDGPLTESDVNLALMRWIESVGAAITIDHVTLRRYLVDAGYLRRDAGGSRYARVLDGSGAVAFAADVAHLDAVTLLEAARDRARAALKQRNAADVSKD
jgi:hypothetical protein